MEWALLTLVLLADRDAQADLARFPPREAVTAAREFNQAYRAQLTNAQGFDVTHWWDYQALTQDAVRRYVAWDALDDVQCARDPWCRCEHLARLRDLIGPQAYYAGQMPAPCDFALFREIGP